MNNNILTISDLNVTFKGFNEEFTAVDAFSLIIKKEETIAIVGESGSGKSTTALSILGLLPYPIAYHNKGSIKFKNIELLNTNSKKLQQYRGSKISMIFQESMMSLNPLHTVNKQIQESILIHNKISMEKLNKRVLELIKLVGLNDAEKYLNSYPHQLSGGQRQRVMIAIAIANNPDLLIADEPTTALDVTIQIQILKLLKEIQKKLGMSILLITHDLGIVKFMAKYVYIMHKSKQVEFGKVKQILSNPKNKYTKSLIKSQPVNLKRKKDFMPGKKLLSVKNIKVYFPIQKGFFKRTMDYFKAVDNISFSLRQGTTLGIVGESGSGKTTLAHAILKLVDSKGDIIFRNKVFKNKSDVFFRRNIQFVFQDPFSSLSPRLSIYEIISEGLEINNIGKNKKDRKKLVIKTLKEVGLDETSLSKYPHEFSGGQRQRISIARAIILKPEIIILDEPTSALDMNTQLQIINLLLSLQESKKLSYIFISHDLKVIKSLADNIIIMKEGKILEEGVTNSVLSSPKNKYTASLVKSSLN
jgi:microcin C transport system ATP-binding protein